MAARPCLAELRIDRIFPMPHNNGNRKGFSIEAPVLQSGRKSTPVLKYVQEVSGPRCSFVCPAYSATQRHPSLLRRTICFSLSAPAEMSQIRVIFPMLFCRTRRDSAGSIPECGRVDPLFGCFGVALVPVPASAGPFQTGFLERL